MTDVTVNVEAPSHPPRRSWGGQAMAAVLILLTWGGFVAWVQAGRNEKIAIADAVIAQDHDRPDHDGVSADDPGVLVDDSLSQGKAWKVSCGTVDGGVATDLSKNVDGGAFMGPFTDLTVQNTSSTCVRLGVKTGVDSAHGIQTGNGCAAGQVLPMHVKAGKCASEGAAVVVDVVGGTP